MADLLTFDAALEVSLSFLSELGMARQLHHKQRSNLNACAWERFIGSSFDRLWKKPDISVVDSCARNIVVESCVRDCCLSTEKHCSRSIN